MLLIDANAAIEVTHETEIGKEFWGCIRNAQEVVAPDIFLPECANAYWQYVRSGAMDEATARQKYRMACNLVTQFVRTNNLMAEVFSQSLFFNHPSYDMVYLVLARRLDATLMSADKQLIKHCCSAGIDIITPIGFSLED